MEINNLLLFILAGLALNITPGPDMLYIITRSISEGSRSGLVSALGISAGCFFHITAVSFGLAGLLEAVPAAFDIVRYLGSAYLLFLGIKMLVTKNKNNHLIPGNNLSLKKVFYQGMVTNILNPKVALFFLAFLPQFVEPSGNMNLQMLLLGVIFNINGTIVNFIVAIFASKAGNVLRSRLTNSKIVKWITASVFIGLGLRLALSGRK